MIASAEEHLGVERAGRYLRKFYPWYADRLGLTRRERHALVTAPTTAHARAAFGDSQGPQRRSRPELGGHFGRMCCCYTPRVPRQEERGFSYGTRDRPHT